MCGPILELTHLSYARTVATGNGRQRVEYRSMSVIDPIILKFAAALGIGLLIGVERERRKGSGSTRAPAGVRTFAVGSLAGAVSVVVGGQLMLAITTAGVIALIAIAYWRGNEKDPGLTTEIALTVTVMLGGLSMQNPALAAGLAVTLTILLAIIAMIMVSETIQNAVKKLYQ